MSFRLVVIVDPPKMLEGPLYNSLASDLAQAASTGGFAYWHHMVNVWLLHHPRGLLLPAGVQAIVHQRLPNRQVIIIDLDNPTNSLYFTLPEGHSWLQEQWLNPPRIHPLGHFPFPQGT